jgi:LacI family transcriptional regulator
MKKATIYTLAKELGTSPSTVSRALNNSAKISEKRRQEIKELAKTRGFKLRDFAPRLTNLCVLICTDSKDEAIFSSYTDQVISGVDHYCSEHDLELSIFSSTQQKLNSMDVVKELFRRNTDGVIVINANSDSRFIAQLENEALPYCCLLCGNPQFPDHILTVNNEDLAEKAIQYLIQLGHRNIAFLYSALHNQAQVDRLNGYRKALAKAGITVTKKHVPSLPITSKTTGIEYGFQAMTKLLNECPEITAVFASSTDLVDGARSAIYRKGLLVPAEISLLGCDDSPQAEYFCPPLTVIDIPNFRLGQTAAAWIHQKIEGSGSPHPPREPWMEGHLIIRETTAEPRKK